MRRSIVASVLAAGLVGLGACATPGEPVILTLAELTQRCEDRGGAIRPTGSETGRAQADYVCQENLPRTPLAGRVQATNDLGRATDNALRRGY